MKCAKAELQKCGGASDISGRCGEGLQCLKTCLPCRTVGDAGLPCIFPFIYQNTTYNKCTARDSDTGQPWCATSVDNTGHVIDYAWGDCAEGCPGTRVECDDRYFSIEEGKCIDVTVPGAIPNWVGAPIVKLEPPTELLFPAPVCKNKGNRREYANTCRCDRGETALDFDLRGIPRGNCTGLDENDGDNLDKVWCFLENIRDPQNPKSGCYSDTTWSAKDGRYWSALACTQDPDVNSDLDLAQKSAPVFTPRKPNIPQIDSRPNPGPSRSFTTTRRPITTTTITTTKQAPLKEETRTSSDFGLFRDGQDYYDDIFNYDVSYDDYVEYEEYIDAGYSDADSIAPTTHRLDFTRRNQKTTVPPPAAAAAKTESGLGADVLRATTLSFQFDYVDDDDLAGDQNTESSVLNTDQPTGNI